MFKTKSLAGILLVMAVLFAQVGIVAAAPQTQEGTTTTITGTITKIETQIDENGETIVLVTLEGYQTISLSAQEAADNLLYDMTTQALTAQVGESVELVVDPNDVIVDEEPEADVHPIAAILASFFGEDPGVINAYHEDGFGFGVIAQAMWVSDSINGDASAAGLILEAKESGDYSNIILSDGTVFALPDGTVPTNWGQFKKALSDKKNNLGIIVSGHAETGDESADLNAQQEHGKGYGKDNNPGKGNGKNKKP